MATEAERDELVMSLLETALALPPSERTAFLQSTRTVHPAVYEEVRHRLEWEERMNGFLRDPLIRRPAPTFSSGDLLGGRFRLRRELGRGGMGVVFEAWDEKLGRPVAVKCARPGYQNRLPPEARAALEVSHPNVCKLYELHTADTAWGPVDFLTMEFVEGETLAERISRDGALAETEARQIAVQLCAGLSQAHHQGVIHGDIKCGNVILSRSPEGSSRAVLTDFGLAKLKPSGGVHVMSAQGGTLDYMAPELFHGARASVASDIYALGVVFHFMLTGKSTQRDADRSSAKAPVLGDLPSRWNRVVTQCLAPGTGAAVPVGRRCFRDSHRAALAH